METEAFRIKFQKIDGIEQLCRILPDFHYGWSYFYKIEDFHLFRDYDYENWIEIQNLEMTLISYDNLVSLTMRFEKICNFSMIGSDSVSGFEIEPRCDHAFGDQRNFDIFDYEEGAISFSCKSIKIISVKKLAAVTK